MTVTFQLQIDPLSPVQFSHEDLAEMYAKMLEFNKSMEKYNQYIRCGMYVDSSNWHPHVGEKSSD